MSSVASSRARHAVASRAPAVQAPSDPGLGPDETVAAVTDGRPVGAELVPAFAPEAPVTEWRAALAAASMGGELATISADQPEAREALSLFAQTARALHKALDAAPQLDRAARLDLLARVERMGEWLANARGTADSAAVALCRGLVTALSEAPR